jgi:hypothetical protein
MARTLKSQQSQSQNETANTDWTKFQRKAVRSFLKRAKAAGITIVIGGEDAGARELNALMRTLGIMSAQQRDYIEGNLTLEELTNKLDVSFGYWANNDDDYSTAE